VELLVDIAGRGYCLGDFAARFSTEDASRSSGYAALKDL
jgi:hypothetical protein